MHKALSGALTASALMVTPLPGAAESEPAKQLKLEEVIVTAQKRAESLSDVPVSVTALDGDKLKKSRH